jgi:hypothetical protein
MTDEQKALLSQALARGYCTKKNKKKTLDSDLIEAMVEELIPVVVNMIKGEARDENSRP